MLYIAVWPSYRNATVSFAPRKRGGVKLTDVSMTPTIAMGDAGMLYCHSNLVSLQGNGAWPEALRGKKSNAASSPPFSVSVLYFCKLASVLFCFVF